MVSQPEGREGRVKKIRYGIIGFGGIAYNRIAKEGFRLDRSRFEKLDSIELIGATDINQEREEAAAELSIPWFKTAEELLRAPNLDAVFIASDNSSHAPRAVQALESGKHCIIEKPLATEVDQALRIQKLARDNRLSLIVDHMMEENVLNIKAAEMIEAGEIGDVNDITLHMEFTYGASPEEAISWRCCDPSELGGPIGDVGSHCLYMAEMLIGSPVSQLSCVYLPKTIDMAVENGAFIQFRFADGRTGSARVAFNQPRGGLKSTLTNLGYEVYGDAGVLRSYGTLFQLSGHEDEPIKLRLELDTHSSVKTISVQEIRNIYTSIIIKHAQSIRDDKPFDGTDAVHNLKLIETCHRSAGNHGKIITLS